MGRAFRYSVVVLALLCVLAASHRLQNVSGSYILVYQNAVVMVEMNEDSRKYLSGGYTSVRIQEDGRLKIDNYTLRGKADGWRVNIAYLDKDLKQLPVAVWGDVDGSVLTLSYIDREGKGGSKVFVRSSAERFYEIVDALQKKSVAIMEDKLASGQNASALHADDQQQRNYATIDHQPPPMTYSTQSAPH